MQLNCKVKWQPPFYINPPFSGLSALSSNIFGGPPAQVTKFLEGPPPNYGGAKHMQD